MKYYVISALLLDDVNTVPLFLSIDEDNDWVYWNEEKWSSSVIQFETIDQARTVLNSREEFIKIENTGNDILLPELLRNVKLDSIHIDEVVLFDTVESISVATIVDEYTTRKALFDAKIEELQQI